MPVKWLHPNPDGHSWTVQTYIEEVAPSIEPGAPKQAKQTWFIVNLQPDGVCMSCRCRPGLQDPVGGYYSCEDRHQCYRCSGHGAKPSVFNGGSGVTALDRLISDSPRKRGRPGPDLHRHLAYCDYARVAISLPGRTKKGRFCFDRWAAPSDLPEPEPSLGAQLQLLVA